MSEPTELQGIATYIFQWQALSDACKRCASLNMREWHDQNLYNEVLWDWWWGRIWDLNVDRSLMHGASGTCRCQLTVRVECDWNKSKWFQDLKESTQTLHNGGVKMSNISEARGELEELRREIQDLQREVTAYRSLLSSTLILMNRAGLKDAGEIQRMTVLLWQVVAAYQAVQAARMAAGDPTAWISAIVSAGGVAVSLEHELRGR